MNRNLPGAYTSKGSASYRGDNTSFAKRGMIYNKEDGNAFGFTQKNSNNQNNQNSYQNGNGRGGNFGNSGNSSSSGMKFNKDEISEARESLKFLSNKMGNNFRGTNDFSVKTTTSTISSNFSNNSTYRQSFKPSFGSNDDDFEPQQTTSKFTANDFVTEKRQKNPVPNNNAGNKRRLPVKEVEDDRPAFSQTHQGF